MEKIFESLCSHFQSITRTNQNSIGERKQLPIEGYGGLAKDVSIIA